MEMIQFLLEAGSELESRSNKGWETQLRWGSGRRLGVLVLLDEGGGWQIGWDWRGKYGFGKQFVSCFGLVFYLYI